MAETVTPVDRGTLLDSMTAATPAALRDSAGMQRIGAALLLAIVAASFLLTISASRRTSTTFDEIIMIAGGARGFETGKFDLAPEHPPFTQYLYGLPVYLDGVQYPPEPVGAHDFGLRYRYSRAFFWEAGNDPERLAFLGRLPAAIAGVLTVVLAFAFTRRIAGVWGGLLAALLVAFLPDLLAHGGVAYNDLPLAAAFLGAVWAFDHAARRPSARTGAVAGAAFALALSIKFSAVALLPVAAVILATEGVSRTENRLGWVRATGVALPAAAAAAWLLLVLVYRGDVLLEEMRYGLDYTFRHVGDGHGAPAYLLGRLSPQGWWYYFPVAFLFKTPAALHLLAVLALFAFTRRSSSGTTPQGGWRVALQSSLRAPIACILVFGGALLTSSLNIGFRYALPVLPLLCVIVAAGVAGAWQKRNRWMQTAIVACSIWYVTGVASQYPHFLSYISEYGPAEGRADLVLLDSSVDWGQGLLDLRDHMQERGIESVYLSYFGSADPKGYGIEYVAMPSFFPLLPETNHDGAAAPDWLAVSATNLHGVYLPGDPFAQLRQARPDTVIANSIFMYRINE